MNETLCPFGANGLKSNIKGTNMCYKARPILNFVGSRLVPNTNIFRIFAEYQLNFLDLYHLLKRPLNVGN